MAGATVDLASYGGKNYLDAANIFDGYVGLPLATTIQKVYMGHGEFPPHPPLKMTQLAKGGRADVIASASDPRIPGVHRVTQAF